MTRKDYDAMIAGCWVSGRYQYMGRNNKQIVRRPYDFDMQAKGLVYVSVISPFFRVKIVSYKSVDLV